MDDMVSIIIPVYNAQKYLNDTITSIKKQTYQNFEVIFIDDMSTDRSADIIKEYLKKDKRFKLIQNKEKQMAANSRNRGVKEAKGRYIAYLDADDLWLDDKLEKQINFLKENDCAFSFTGYEFSNELGIPTGKKVAVPKKMHYKDALKNTTIFTSTVMFDLKKIKKIDIMMPDVKSEDTACWWRILKKGYTAYGLDEILSYYRRSGNTLSSNKLVAIKRIWNLYRNCEKLNVFSSLYNFIFWAFNAVKRRI